MNFLHAAYSNTNKQDQSLPCTTTPNPLEALFKYLHAGIIAILIIEKRNQVKNLVV